MEVLWDLTAVEVAPLVDPYDMGVFGCCGARYVTDASGFNDFTETDPKEHWDGAVCFKQFNRGILLGRNIKEEDVIPIENSIVESFTVEGETFFVRIRQ